MTYKSMGCLFKEVMEELIKDENLKIIKDIFDANFVDDIKIPFTRLKQRYSSEIVDGEYMRITVKLFEGDKERATYTEIVSSISEAKKVVDKIHKAIDKIAMRYIVIEKRENRPGAIINDCIRQERNKLENIAKQVYNRMVLVKDWISREYPDSYVEIFETGDEDPRWSYSIRGYVKIDGFKIDLPSVDSKGRTFVYDRRGVYDDLDKYIGTKLRVQRGKYNSNVEKYIKNVKVINFHEDGTFDLNVD